MWLLLRFCNTANSLRKKNMSIERRKFRATRKIIHEMWKGFYWKHFPLLRENSKSHEHRSVGFARHREVGTWWLCYKHKRKSINYQISILVSSFRFNIILTLPGSYPTVCLQFPIHTATFIFSGCFKSPIRVVIYDTRSMILFLYFWYCINPTCLV